ncbi:AAA family ATPase [Actinomadura decatromicini]|uniref:AAA family ATPase n=1 Tax=Actinomadura decatromicini TaxID=2604572 RepID=UPI0016532159|nr:AAA family ATPase [Actinomadura decatromicini]
MSRENQRLRGPGGELGEVLEEVTRELGVEQRLARADAPAWAAAALTAGDEFVLDTPATPPAVWGRGEAVGWAEGESLMLVGPPGVGKTTLVVQLVAARLGLVKTVLGLPVQAGARRVLYLALDRPRRSPAPWPASCTTSTARPWAEVWWCGRDHRRPTWPAPRACSPGCASTPAPTQSSSTPSKTPC